MNSHIQALVWTCVFTSLKALRRSGSAGSRGHMVTCLPLGTCQTVSKAAATCFPSSNSGCLGVHAGQAPRVAGMQCDWQLRMMVPPERQRGEHRWAPQRGADLWPCPAVLCFLAFKFLLKAWPGSTVRGPERSSKAQAKTLLSGGTRARERVNGTER